MSRRALAKKVAVTTSRSTPTTKKSGKSTFSAKRGAANKRKIGTLQSLKGNLTPKEKANTILSHMDSAVRIGWSLLNRWRIRLPQDEVQSIAGMALCEAANRFNKKLGVSFRTFFFYHLRGLLLREISRRISEQRLQAPVDTTDSSHHAINETVDISLWPSSLIEHDDPEKIAVKGEVSRLCWDACADLDELERDVILRFFVEEQNVSDIAKELGYCRCHISRVKSRALAQVSRRLKSTLQEDDQIGEGGLTLAMKVAQSAQQYRGGRGRRKVANE